MNINPYLTLGVLRDAEQIVITAAYRALAQRYHPDRWAGPSEEAHRRMAEINLAYSMIGTPEKRRKFDQSQPSEQAEVFNESEDEGINQAFKSAMESAEERWSLASQIYTDLPELRTSLSRISSSLAFAFVTVMLEHKKFENRQDIAHKMERLFLTRYFGSNSALLEYAKKLIMAGQRGPAKALNQLVDVLGTEVPPHKLIDRIEKQFNLQELWQRQAEERNRQAEERSRQAEEQRSRQAELERLSAAVCRYQDVLSASAFCKHLNYSIDKRGQGLFKPTVYTVTSPAGTSTRFENKYVFIAWVIKNLCIAKGSKDKYCGICTHYKYHSIGGYKCDIHDRKILIHQVCDQWESVEEDLKR